MNQCVGVSISTYLSNDMYINSICHGGMHMSLGFYPRRKNSTLFLRTKNSVHVRKQRARTRSCISGVVMRGPFSGIGRYR